MQTGFCWVDLFVALDEGYRSSSLLVSVLEEAESDCKDVLLELRADLRADAEGVSGHSGARVLFAISAGGGRASRLGERPVLGLLICPS